MTTPTTSKTGHHTLDFPDIIGHAYAGNNPTIAPLPVIFLSKLPSSRRQEVLEQIKQGDGTPWPADIPKCALGAVPWLRNFDPTINDVLRVTSGVCIVIIDSLLREEKCIMSHTLFLNDPPSNDHIREFAVVKITDAYELTCSQSSRTSWFPATLSIDHQFFPTQNPESEARIERRPEISTVDLPVFVTVPLTPEQQTYLFALLCCDSSEPEFFHVPNKDNHVNDIDHLMAYFLDRAWFPGDFVVIDARTLSSIPTPIPTSSEPPPCAEFDPPYPSFLLCTELHIWHHASDEQLVARDQVGYVAGRTVIEDSEDYALWSGNVFRSIGLGRWIGWRHGENEEGIDEYYWGCWFGTNGGVDEEVKANAVIKD